MQQPSITGIAQHFGGSIGGMVIDYDDIELEIRLLVQRAFNSIENCTLAIFNRNDDAGSNRIFLCRTSHAFKARLEPGANAFEMLGRDRLHLQLVITILWVYVIELLLSGRPRIQDGCFIERFGYADDGKL